MKKYINLSLCGCKAKLVDLKDLDGLELGFYKDEILNRVKSDRFDDWSELVFSLEESVPVPVDLDAGKIYDLVASWCVNVAFGKMKDHDSVSTLEDIASQLDLIDKGDEFRHLADLDYLRGEFARRDWTDFEPDYILDEEIDGYQTMSEEELQGARDIRFENYTFYNIKDYLRGLDLPFGVYKDTEPLLVKYLSGEESTESTWY